MTTEKQISGDPEMIRIATEVMGIALEAFNESNRQLRERINEQQATIDRLVKLTELRVVK